MTRSAPRNLLQGQAGVYQVASQLCLRGFNPHFPAVDIGTDLLIDGGIRIQVKAAQLRHGCTTYPQGAYWFKLGKTTIKQRRQVWVNVRFTDFCDFVVFWGIDQHRFWIVPAGDIDGHQCLVLGPDIWYRDLDVEKIHQLRAAGRTMREIAAEFGVTDSTISRRLRGLHVLSQRTLCDRVRNCENRWDLIRAMVDSSLGVLPASMSDVSPPQQIEQRRIE